MRIKQLYTPCLSEAAYFIESNGQAAVIDPLREVEPYLELARQWNAEIKYVFETHFHADFVSGHIDLADTADATIVYGPTAKPGFDAHVAADGEIIQLGDIRIKVLHTPGHTMESSCFLLIDERGKDHAIFTGDTLFLGDVGRPDLAVKTDLSREDLAGKLFDSLRKKIMPLSDGITVYPGHGKGSACGKLMSDATVDRLGNQKRTNYALQPDLSRSKFIEKVTTGLVAPPQYFPKNAKMNKEGYTRFEDVLDQGVTGLYVHEFIQLAEKNDALIIDTRSANAFAEGHIPGSVFFGISGDFAPWFGALVNDIDRAILFVADPDREAEVVTRLARVGYDNTLGYLIGGMDAWKKEGKDLAKVEQVRAKDIQYMSDFEVHLLDVRKASEFEMQHVVGARSVPLGFMDNCLPTMNGEHSFFVYCAGGYRSMIAASILKRRGFHNVVNIKGGFKALSKTGLVLSKYQPQVSML